MGRLQENIIESETLGNDLGNHQKLKSILTSATTRIRGERARGHAMCIELRAERVQVFQMSYLDNLENSLKNLESRDERDGAEAARRQRDRKQALAAGPWADRLRSSDFTQQLFHEAALAGHRIRAKIYIAWMGTKLRLEVRGRTLNLIPAADGVVAEYSLLSGETVRERVDLNSKPVALLNRWLAGETAPAPVFMPDLHDEERA